MENITVNKCDNHAEHICVSCVMHGKCRQEASEHFDLFMNPPVDASVRHINETARINIEKYGAVIYSGIVG